MRISLKKVFTAFTRLTVFLMFKGDLEFKSFEDKQCKLQEQPGTVLENYFHP